MVDLKLQVPATEPVEVDDEALKAVDKGAEAADAGRTVALDEARKSITRWISKFASQKPR